MPAEWSRSNSPATKNTKQHKDLASDFCVRFACLLWLNRSGRVVANALHHAMSFGVLDRSTFWLWNDDPASQCGERTAIDRREIVLEPGGSNGRDSFVGDGGAGSGCLIAGKHRIGDLHAAGTNVLLGTFQIDAAPVTGGDVLDESGTRNRALGPSSLEQASTRTVGHTGD